MKLSGSKKLICIIKRNNDYFYYFICPHSFATENKLESCKKVCKNKYFCNIVMLSEDTKILHFNQNQKSDKEPFIIDPDLESLIEKIDECKSNPEKLPVTKVGEHIPLGIDIKNKHDICRGRCQIKKFCESLREHAMKMINLKKKKKRLVTNEQQKLFEDAKV